MKEFAEKLIERLEEKTFTQMVKVQVDDIVFPPAYTYESCEVVTLDDVKAVANNLAEEYINTSNTSTDTLTEWKNYIMNHFITVE